MARAPREQQQPRRRVLLGVTVAVVATVLHGPVSSTAFAFGASALDGSCGVPDAVPCAPSLRVAATLLAVSSVLVACSLWAGFLVALPSARRRPARVLGVTLGAVVVVQVLVAVLTVL